MTPELTLNKPPLGEAPLRSLACGSRTLTATFFGGDAAKPRRSAENVSLVEGHFTRWCPSSLAKLVYNSHNYGLWQIQL